MGIKDLIPTCSTCRNRQPSELGLLGAIAALRKRAWVPGRDIFVRDNTGLNKYLAVALLAHLPKPGGWRGTRSFARSMIKDRLRHGLSCHGIRAIQRMSMPRGRMCFSSLIMECRPLCFA
ncbi:hypothetical protein DPM35_29025 [Mesorhizobium atlanticum]|uniref:Uncharacterized protein n=1 Tax=Mesorhizobium atlanticum TaxID=2233532 RepID=A0A330GLT8_9HYPH|nr:hypothetical protein DPM35_29025 [Mesorhizobium atlanticum]